MTEQRYDIVVQDKVARSIKTEMLAIASATQSARQSLASFKAQMGAMTGSMRSLQGGAQTLRSQAQAAQQATSAIQAQTAAIQAQAQALNTLSRAQRGTTQNPLGGGGSGGGGGGSASRGGSSVSGIAQASRNARGLNQVGEQARLASQHMANLSFQLNDVFVSLASGQKPLTVFIQQGAQVAQIPAMAGMSFKQFGVAALNTMGIVKRTGDAALDAAASIAAQGQASLAAANEMAAGNVRIAETESALAAAQQRQAVTANEVAAAQARVVAAHTALTAASTEAAVAAEALSVANTQVASTARAAAAAETVALAPLGVLLAVVAVGTAAAATSFALLNREANNNSGLKQYTKEMGYTKAEVKKLNAVTVTWGDTAKAVFQVGWRRLVGMFGMSTADMRKGFSTFLDWMATASRATISGIYAAFTGGFYAIARASENAQKGKFENPLSTMVEGYKDAYKSAQGFLDDVVKQSRANAKDRQDKMAADMFDPRKTPKGAKGWDRAKELRDANSELDAQNALLGKYGDELERATKLEAIAKPFREHGVPLTEAETAALSAKIQIQQEGARVQEQMNSIYADTIGREKEYYATLQALTRAVNDNVVSEQEGARRRNLAIESYKNAIDPLRQYNIQMQQLQQTLHLYGTSLADAQRAQQLFNEAIANGTTNSDTGSYKDYLEQARKEREAQESASAFEAIDPKSNRDIGGTSYILENYKKMYEEIARLREADVISDQDAQERKKNLDQALLDARLDAAGQFYSGFAALQNSKVRELAALGKAAAIAEATINGFVAVTRTMREFPGPIGIALGVAQGVAAAAQVAQIAGIGFQTGGFTGYGSNAQDAGRVHKNEFVMDAQATARIGVPALEAARRTGNLSQPAAANSNMPNINITAMPGVVFEERMTPTGEIELIAERVARRVAPKAFADDLNRGPNSVSSKAVQTQYGVVRNR